MTLSPPVRNQHALLYATGWLHDPGSDVLRLAGLDVRPHARLTPLLGQRVKAVLRFHTTSQGRLRTAGVVRVRPAGPLNTHQVHWSALGRLWRCDLPESTLTLRLIGQPRQPGKGPGEALFLRGTHGLLRQVQPEWRYVHAHGGVVAGHLIFDTLRDALAAQETP